MSVNKKRFFNRVLAILLAAIIVYMNFSALGTMAAKAQLSDYNAAKPKNCYLWQF